MNESIPATFQHRRLKEFAVLFVGFSACLIVAVWCLSSMTGKTWDELFGILFFCFIILALAGTWIKRYADRKKRGSVILDLGPAPPPPKQKKVAYIFQLCAGLLFLVQGLLSPESSYAIWFGAMFLLIPIFSLWIRVGERYQVCDNGLWLIGFIPWSAIRQYEWESSWLWIRTKSTPFRFSDCRATIPEDQKQAVDELMRKHVNHGELVEAG
jgi:hypothetical protein